LLNKELFTISESGVIILALIKETKLIWFSKLKVSLFNLESLPKDKNQL